LVFRSTPLPDRFAPRCPQEEWSIPDRHQDTNVSNASRADPLVTIFDYYKLQDRATYEKPMEFPTGIEWVLVNGVVTIDHGKHTGAKAGQALLGPGASAP